MALKKKAAKKVQKKPLPKAKSAGTAKALKISPKVQLTKKAANKVTKKVIKKAPPKTPTPSAVKSVQIPSVGDSAPGFTLDTDHGETLSLSSLKGRWVILYFYPKDNTSGCTAQACDFQNNLSQIVEHGAVVIGVSPDSAKSHANFRSKHSLSFPLGIDQDTTVAQNYGVWVKKSMYGRQYMGIQRATFLIDPKGKLATVWPKVKVARHVDEVIAALNQHLST